MPRSFIADRQAFNNRAEKASLGRFSVGTDVSLGSAATQHWVNSVSDIYGRDEIEELLDDLNRLEMASLDADDFDIDGSQIGGFGRLGLTESLGRVDALPKNNSGSSYDQGQPASPAASPTWSVKSWDSHTHYQEFKEPDDDPVFFGSRPMNSVICYCDISIFKTPRTVLRVLLLATSVACLTTLLTAGTAKIGLFALPNFPRLRLMIFVTIFAIIFTSFVLFLNISHLHALLPVDYGKMQTAFYLLLTVAYLVASSLLLHAHQTGFLDDKDIDDDDFYDDNHPRIPVRTKHHILIASILGFLCSVETFMCSFNCGRPSPSYDKMAESSTHFTLHETVTPRAVTNDSIQIPSAPPLKSSRYPRSHQYLLNENYDSERVIMGAARALTASSSGHKTNNNKKSGSQADKRVQETNLSSTNSSHQLPPIVKNSKSATSRSAHDSKVSNNLANKQTGANTGAIPKQILNATKNRSNENHMDEIVAIPMDVCE